jgi:hypothetical protein
MTIRLAIVFTVLLRGDAGSGHGNSVSTMWGRGGRFDY